MNGNRVCVGMSELSVEPYAWDAIQLVIKDFATWSGLYDSTVLL